MLLLISAMGYAQKNGEPKGTWTYECPDAPSEHQTGKLEFKSDNGKLTMAMIINGTPGTAATVTKKDGAYSWTLSIDGYEVLFNVTPDGDGLKGTATADQWEFPITMKPLKK